MSCIIKIDRKEEGRFMIKVIIKEVLEDKDKSIYWVAEETGMSYSNVYNLINNKNAGIQFETLDKIMEVLEIEDFNKVLKR